MRLSGPAKPGPENPGVNRISIARSTRNASRLPAKRGARPCDAEARYRSWAFHLRAAPTDDNVHERSIISIGSSVNPGAMRSG